MAVLNFGQPRDGIVQIAYIVEDIHKSMPVYSQQLNIGPWFLFENFPFSRLEYRGDSSGAEIDLCLGFNGHMMFELIQQRNDAPSVYKEIAESRGYGYHHSAISVLPERYDDVLDKYKAQGFQIALDAEVDVGGRASYIDTFSVLGGFIEMIEMTEGVEKLFTEIYRASIDWDGTDPIRRME